jgi:hypothetical protein
MGEKNDHITDFRPYYCTALNLQGGWFSASDAARLAVRDQTSLLAASANHQGKL